MKRIISICILFICVGCKLNEPIQKNVSKEDDCNRFITSSTVLDRAYQMASIEWTPLKPIPKRGDDYYTRGVTQKGVPYSSVKEINTYLFQDVSYHTFMTAVHNPKSVLYTEDISKAPYHGTNCAPYYGAVCSSSVMWALGIDIPYSASQIISLPDMKQVEFQDIDSLRICDIIWQPGHVQMIYAMNYQADTLYSITTFETSGAGSHIIEYTKENFIKMWDDEGYVSYRYAKLRYSSIKETLLGFEPVEYNDDLCPSKGDRAVYRTTDTIQINIFNTDYDKIVLTRKKSIISEQCGSSIHYFYNLQPGTYYVYLENGESRSKEISFEVIDTSIRCSRNGSAESIVVHFNSSSNPQYVALCDITGASLCYPIMKKDKQKGYITVPIENAEKGYCKVIFKGQYGRIISVPIRFY